MPDDDAENDDALDALLNAQEDFDFLPDGAPHLPYNRDRAIAENRRMMLQTLRNQKIMAKRLIALERIERDRKLYFKIVSYFGSVGVIIFLGAASFFAGWWKKG